MIQDKTSMINSIIYIDEKVAVEESKKFPNQKIEIFIQEGNKFIPTYCHYLNGDLIES